MALIFFIINNYLYDFPLMEPKNSYDDRNTVSDY